MAEAREEVVGLVQAEVWSVEYPGEKADPSAMALQMVRGGLVVPTIPSYRSSLAMVSVLETLEADAKWLDEVAEKRVEEGELDPNREAIWETSEEGQEALDRRHKRDRERLEETMGPRVGWGDE